jgi:1,4-dihydroxy-2-naphthoate octaprenyltransferase
MGLRKIFDKDTILLLRIPFSFFLLPIFIFGLSQSPHINWANTAVLFVVLHFFIYPGSNAYNSYMDKDKGSIGGLARPPEVTLNLYYASMIMDGIGLLLCLLVGWQLMLMILLYILVSKAYSWHGIRLKKYGILSWIVVVVFQGGYTFLMVNMTAQNDYHSDWFTLNNIECMWIATLLIGGFYPLTQIYQHEEDSERGDMTISYRLGVTGTFIFSACMFVLANIVGYFYFSTFYTVAQLFIFNACLLPVTAYFLYWFVLSIRNKNSVDFAHAMRMTSISSLSMILCFGVLFFINHRG